MQYSKKPKYLGKSDKYKGVYRVELSNIPYWYASQGKYKKTGFETEREAGLWVDMRLIEEGEEPVNILKRK